MNKKKRKLILQYFSKNSLHSAIGLKYTSSFELLISVLLSARATDVSVNKATAKLYSVANTPQEILNLGVEGVKSYIRSVGLFNNKSKNIIGTCRILLDKHNGEIPKDRVALEALPGVGRKTANVILNIIFDMPTIAVDTHVFRVCNRTRFVIGKNVNQMEKKLLQVVPPKFKVGFHRWFVLHGRNICVAHRPRCEFCAIEHLCEYEKKSIIRG